ncbi:MAG: UvrD-helicase domain-containing protein, partial [Nitrospinae bacterium]|nr:UvrD-helicase domain-containing protein [Nitrospinota bacterium]
THVITHRIAHLIATKRARPEEILALTFTEKAAAEMEERVDVLLPYGFTNVSISTFHAFGDRLLREHALELGLPPDVRLMTQAEQVIFLKERLFRLPLDYFRPLGDPTRYLQALVTLFSRCRDEDVSPDEYLEYAEGLRVQSAANPEDEALAESARREDELSRTYAAYYELKAEAGCIDFGDQVALPLALLRTHPTALQAYQERFRYILVDEFQDTNYGQFELVKLLAAGHRNVTVVGDDDQSIYKFRGAAISNILGFMDHYPEATTVVLAENYRSYEPILDGAYRLIRHNDPDRLEVRQGVDKRIVAGRGGGAAIRHHNFDTLSSESDFVARTIDEAVEGGELSYRDFAILVRSNNNADPFIRALNARAIPHRFSGTRGLYGRPEVRMAINFLRAVADVTDSMALYYLASSEAYSLSAVDLSRCMNYAKRINRPLHTILERLEAEPNLEEVSHESRATIAELLKDLSGYVELALRRSPGEVLYAFLQRSGWIRRLARRASASAEEELGNLARFFNIVRSAEGVLRENRVPQFVKHLDLLMEAGDDPATAEADSDADAVNVLTVHRAKGLEFPVVFLVSLVEGRFPWSRRSEAIPLPDALVKDYVKPWADRVTFVQGDMLNEADLEQVASHEISRIVHAAVFTGVLPEVEADRSRSIIEVNVMGTTNVLELARRLSVERFLYVSSGSVYGEDYAPNEALVEDTTPRPQSLYALTKYTSELLTRRYGSLHGFPTVSTRLGTPYGPMERVTDHRANQSVLKAWTGSIVRSEPIEVEDRKVE